MAVRVLAAAAVLVALALLAGALWSAMGSAMETAGRNAINARNVVESAGPHR